MPYPERRNEAAMLRAFHKQYPSYNLTPLLYKRHQQLIDARAFSDWLAKRRERQEGEAYADELGRMTDVVNRRIPQLRWSPAERAGVRRVARDVTAGRNTSQRLGRVRRDDVKDMEERRAHGFRVRPSYGQVLGYIAEGEPLPINLPNRNASILTSSHFWLDDYPQSSEPEPAPLPHTTVDPQTSFEDANEGYDGVPFPCAPGPSTWTARATWPWTPARRCGTTG